MVAHWGRGVERASQRPGCVKMAKIVGAVLAEDDAYLAYKNGTLHGNYVAGKHGGTHDARWITHFTLQLRDDGSLHYNDSTWVRYTTTIPLGNTHTASNSARVERPRDHPRIPICLHDELVFRTVSGLPRSCSPRDPGSAWIRRTAAASGERHLVTRSA